MRRLRHARAAPLALGLLVVFCALAGPGLALDPQRHLSEYRSMVWSDDTGLLQEWIDSIAQTPDGYLWLGGHEGLTRFDAKRFVRLLRALGRRFWPGWEHFRAGARAGGREARPLTPVYPGPRANDPV